MSHVVYQRILSYTLWAKVGIRAVSCKPRPQQVYKAVCGADHNCGLPPRIQSDCQTVPRRKNISFCNICCPQCRSLSVCQSSPSVRRQAPPLHTSLFCLFLPQFYRSELKYNHTHTHSFTRPNYRLFYLLSFPHSLQFLLHQIPLP